MDSSKELFSCAFCHRGFARNDALKRHWTTCKIRRERAVDVPTVQCRTRGRKLRACDRCSQLKRACNSTEPCVPCSQRKQSCTYSRRRLSSVNKSFTSDMTVTADSPNSGPFDMSAYESSFSALNELNHKDFSTQDDMSIGSYSTFSFEQIAGFDLQGWDFSWAVFDEHSLAASLCHRPTDLNIEVLIRFSFLGNFTKSTGFVKSFECGRPECVLSQISELFNTRSSKRLLSLGPSCNESETHWIDIAEAALIGVSKEASLDKYVRYLLPKTHEIVALIRQATINKPRRSIIPTVWSTSVEAQCYEFFHPTNMAKYLALFWSCWSPNWPTIHRPTFVANEKSPCLIAAMVIVGACLSPEHQDRRMAQAWLNVVEEAIFHDELFSHQTPSEAWCTSGDAMSRQAQLDVLQAAYCVCLYQTWEGGKQSKKRILRYRFNEVIFLARDIGLERASLQTVDTSSQAAFDWQEFIARESLIRNFAYICNLDSGFAQFFRRPPRLVPSQMVVDLTSPEACFQATSAEDCFIALRTWRSTMGSAFADYTISTAVEALYDPVTSTTSALQKAFSHMSILNMFTLISVIYSQTFTLETALVPTTRLAAIPPIETALRQWKELWPSPSRDAELVTMAHDQPNSDLGWRRIGFFRHAPEYWLLTHLTVERILKGTGSSRSNGSNSSSSLPLPPLATEVRRIGLAMNCEDCDMIEAHALISNFQRLNPTSV